MKAIVESLHLDGSENTSHYLFDTVEEAKADLMASLRRGQKTLDKECPNLPGCRHYPNGKLEYSVVDDYENEADGTVMTVLVPDLIFFALRETDTSRSEKDGRVYRIQRCGHPEGTGNVCDFEDDLRKQSKNYFTLDEAIDLANGIFDQFSSDEFHQMLTTMTGIKVKVFQERTKLPVTMPGNVAYEQGYDFGVMGGGERITVRVVRD